MDEPKVIETTKCPCDCHTPGAPHVSVCNHCINNPTCCIKHFELGKLNDEPCEGKKVEPSHIFTWADAILIVVERILKDGIENKTIGLCGMRTLDADFQGIPYAVTVSVGNVEVQYVKSMTNHYGNVLKLAEIEELKKGKIITPNKSTVIN